MAHRSDKRRLQWALALSVVAAFLAGLLNVALAAVIPLVLALGVTAAEVRFGWPKYRLRRLYGWLGSAFALAVLVLAVAIALRLIEGFFAQIVPR